VIRWLPQTEDIDGHGSVVCSEMFLIKIHAHTCNGKCSKKLMNIK